MDELQDLVEVHEHIVVESFQRHSEVSQSALDDDRKLRTRHYETS
jgi:hypothetical protein